MATLRPLVEEKIEAEGAFAEGPAPGDVREVAIGIDLGTTNSSAAYFDRLSRAARVLHLETGAVRTRLPSVVWFDQASGELAVGDRARRAAALYPDAVKAEFKRDMPHAASVGYRLGNPDTGTTREETPLSLSTAVLREIKRRSERELSKELGAPVRVRRAVVTVPANFPEEATAATMQAARDAGFEEVKLLDEPTAAALAYALHEDTSTGTRIVVFDFGGGTLDCSMLSSPGDDGKPFKVANPCGDPALGGKDFDAVLTRLLADQVQAQSRRPIEEGPFDVLSDEDLGISARKRGLWAARLKEEAERIKVVLGELESESFSISSEELVDYDNTPLDVNGEVSRDAFEAATQGLIERAIGVLERTLTEAGIAAADVDRLVLVGGTTLIPAVEAAITRKLGTRPYKNVDRLTAVAQGAAIYEFLTAPRPVEDGAATGKVADERTWIDVLATHNFGVRFRHNRLDRLIAKNTRLPCTPAMQTYQPVSLDAEQVVVALYQYDDSLIKRAEARQKETGAYEVVVEPEDIDTHHATEIGSVIVEAPRDANRAIDVTFTMDDNRILSVAVRRQHDGHTFPLQIARTT